MNASREAKLIRAVAAVGTMLFAAATPARTLSFSSVATSTAWTYSWSSAERYAIVLERQVVESPPCGASSDWCWEEVYPDQFEQSSSSLANVVVQNSVEGSNALLIDTARAEGRASTRLGSNKAYAIARDSSEYDFELVDESGDVSYASTGSSWSQARAESSYNDPFVASGSGEATFRFVVERHATTPPSGGGLGAFSDPVKSFAYYSDLYGGTTSGALDVLLYRLDGASPFLVNRQKFDIGAEPGIENFSFAAHLEDGLHYAFIVSLSAFAKWDGAMDLYGTATLSGIQVQAGQSLSFNSGSVYSVTAVPEPESWVMLLAGITLCAAVARRRRLT
jgi:hypothetical protein